MNIGPLLAAFFALHNSMRSASTSRAAEESKTNMDTPATSTNLRSAFTFVVFLAQKGRVTDDRTWGQTQIREPRTARKLEKLGRGETGMCTKLIRQIA